MHQHDWLPSSPYYILSKLPVLHTQVRRPPGLPNPSAAVASRAFLTIIWMSRAELLRVLSAHTLLLLERAPQDRHGVHMAADYPGSAPGSIGWRGAPILTKVRHFPGKPWYFAARHPVVYWGPFHMGTAREVEAGGGHARRHGPLALPSSSGLRVRLAVSAWWHTVEIALYGVRLRRVYTRYATL